MPDHDRFWDPHLIASDGTCDFAGQVRAQRLTHSEYKVEALS